MTKTSPGTTSTSKVSTCTEADTVSGIITGMGDLLGVDGVRIYHDQALLKEAGVAMPLAITINVLPNPAARDTAEIVQAQLNKGGFKREDEHLLSFMANFAAVGIQREREARFRQRLERYHSPQVVSQILKNSQNLEGNALQAQRSEISVLRGGNARPSVYTVDMRQALLHVVAQQDYAIGIAGDPKNGKPCASYFTCGTPLANDAEPSSVMVPAGAPIWSAIS